MIMAWVNVVSSFQHRHRIQTQTQHSFLSSAGPPVGDGPPRGGPPSAPPSGGPPPSSPLVESIINNAFKVLYVADSRSLIDSSKNLRVLWTRALLNTWGEIDDDIAQTLLPQRTKFIVTNPSFASLLVPIKDKFSWITKRTKYIDGVLENFLREHPPNTETTNVVVIGAGYDTRSLRYGRKEVQFYEVDLPDIVQRKSLLFNSDFVSSLPLDLNSLENSPSIIELLKSGTTFDESKPTLFVFEAVLFYLSPESVANLMTSIMNTNNNNNTYVITDSLMGMKIFPGPSSNEETVAKWFAGYGKKMISHDKIWGGAVHLTCAVDDEKSPTQK